MPSSRASCRAPTANTFRARTTAPTAASISTTAPHGASSAARWWTNDAARLTPPREDAMPMLKSVAAESPDAYVASLSGWQGRQVAALRDAVRGAAPLDERIKWGHLVFFASGPVLLIRAEAQRVLFGFWRGRRLRAIEPRLKPGGKYEMATLEIVEATPLALATVLALADAAAALNRRFGDPTDERGGAH